MSQSAALVAVALAAAWFCAFLGAHVIGWRAGRGNAQWLVRCYAASILGTLISVTACTAGSSVTGEIGLCIVLALMTSGCLFVVYVPAVYTVLTSLSVQTLILLGRAGGALPEAELYARFSGRPIVADRLATLAASGYLTHEQERFRLTIRGRMIAALFARLKELWKLGAGG